MTWRNLLLIAMLTASLCAAKKKPVEHDWQTGKLVTILPFSSNGEFSDSCVTAEVSISKLDYDQRVMLVIERSPSAFMALLNPRQKPKIRVGPVKYAIEPTQCVLCPHDRTAPDELGRTREKATGTKFILYLLDEDNRIFRLSDVHEKPCRTKNDPDPLRGLGPDKKQE